MNKDRVMIIITISVFLGLTVSSFLLGSYFGRQSVFNNANSELQLEIQQVMPGITCDNKLINNQTTLNSIIRSAVKGENVVCPSPTYQNDSEEQGNTEENSQDTISENTTSGVFLNGSCLFEENSIEISSEIKTILCDNLRTDTGAVLQVTGNEGNYYSLTNYAAALIVAEIQISGEIDYLHFGNDAPICEKFDNTEAALLIEQCLDNNGQPRTPIR